MPRYYFHLHDGRDLPDLEGLDLIDLRAAQAHAAEIVFLQLKEDASTGTMTELWTLDVKDHAQRIVFTLKFESVTPV